MYKHSHALGVPLPLAELVQATFLYGYTDHCANYMYHTNNLFYKKEASYDNR